MVTTLAFNRRSDKYIDRVQNGSGTGQTGDPEAQNTDQQDNAGNRQSESPQIIRHQKAKVVLALL